VNADVRAKVLSFVLPDAVRAPDRSPAADQENDDLVKSKSLHASDVGPNVK
jgi:hypothetical protein